VQKPPLFRWLRQALSLPAMKILSIRQPWASLIVSGIKDVENRIWATRYRGPMLVHASLRADDISGADLVRYYGSFLPSDQPRGGVIGVVDIVGCVRPYSSRWYAPGCGRSFSQTPAGCRSSSGRAHCRSAMLRVNCWLR
jgi:hypothetical protein